MQYALVLGHIWDNGLKIVGPFEDPTEAEAFAEYHTDGENYWIVPMPSPDEYREMDNPELSFEESKGLVGDYYGKTNAMKELAKELGFEILDIKMKPILDHQTNQDEHFLGEHQFSDLQGNVFGSFVVHKTTEGLFYWECLGERRGPFLTAEGAYLDAMENEHASYSG